jgi:hypothetical protein
MDLERCTFTCSQIKTRINHYKCRTVASLILDCLCRNRKKEKILANIKFYRTLWIERKFRKCRQLSADKKNPDGSYSILILYLKKK